MEGATQTKPSDNRIYAAAICNLVVVNTDAIGKIAKVANSLFELSAYALEGAAESLKGAGQIFKDFGDITGAIGILDRTVEWLDPKERGKILGTSGRRDWKKIASKVALTAAQFFAFVSFIDKATNKSLSTAALCLGKLPIIDLVKNVGFALSATITIYTEITKLVRGGNEINAAARKTAMIKIAAEVSKLCMIIIGTALGIFAGYASTQLLLAVSVLGLATNLLGLRQTLWEKVFQHTPETLLVDLG